MSTVSLEVICTQQPLDKDVLELQARHVALHLQHMTGNTARRVGLMVSIDIPDTPDGDRVRSDLEEIHGDGWTLRVASPQPILDLAESQP